MSCGCAPTYLPAGGNAAVGVRRIIGEQAVGDFHVAENGEGVHLWTGEHWRELLVRE